MTRERALYNNWMEQLKPWPDFAAELQDIAENDDEILDRFYQDLSFGTAGLRGVLGMGTNRMNIFTVRRATQGLAQYLLTQKDKPSAAIAWDSRHCSELFARETAGVLAANGIQVHIYQELMPTPALSYAVRQLGCDSGVVITASHNPAKYNGYKAYGADGCQIGPEVADEVLSNIGKLDYFGDEIRCISFEEGLQNGMIRQIPDSFVEQFVQRIEQEALDREAPKKANLKLVYTPLNGAGRRCVLDILERIGVRDITVVPEQEMPDGNFPTCPYPNPEMPEALQLGLDLCRRTGADLLLATDPDADRVAVAVREKSGAYTILSGNEVGVLLLDYICTARKAAGRIPERPVTVKSIVSTPLADAVAKEHGVEMVSVLTGFKWIGEVIAGLEEKGEEDRFIFGFEESCGYLSGGYVRDKDAVDASMLLVEMASAYKLQDQTLCDALQDIYRRHGIYSSVVESFSFEGADGMREMAEIMQRLRDNPPADIAGDAVVCRTDYETGVRCTSAGDAPTGVPASNVLEYVLENGSTVMVRPSGTEPKIKIYYSLVGDTPERIAVLKEHYGAACRQLIGVN